jgi:hypothetical protein
LNTREAIIRPRIRKLIGTIAPLALVVVWSLLAMALAQIVLVRAERSPRFCLLRHCRPRMGGAGDAADLLDVARRRTAVEVLMQRFRASYRAESSLRNPSWVAS